MDTPGSLEYGGRGRPKHGVIRSPDVRNGRRMSEVARPRRHGPRSGAGSAFRKRSVRTPRPISRPRSPSALCDQDRWPGPGPADRSVPLCLRRPKPRAVNGIRGRHAAHGAIGSSDRSAMRACAGRRQRPTLIAVACWWIREGQGVRCVGAPRPDTSSGRRRVPKAPFRPAPPRIGCGGPGHRAARPTPRGRSHPAEFPMSGAEGKQKL